MFKKCFISCLFLFFFYSSHAQYVDQFDKIILLEQNENAPIYTVKLKSGSAIVGQIIKKESGQLFILVKDLGEIKVDMDKVESIASDEKDLLPDSKEMTKMIGSAHNLITPTGYNLEKGEANIQFTEIFLVGFGYGLTDNFSISAGMSFLPGVEFSEQLYYIIPKFTLPISNSVSLSAEIIPTWAVDENFTLAGISGSFGKRDKNFSIGYISPISDGLFGSGGIINLSATLRVSNKVALLTDNLLPIYGSELEGGGAFASLGTRLIGESGSFDFGFLFVSEIEGVPFPFISYTLRL